MKVETAQLPGPDQSDDRIFVTTNAVIMLDGASSLLPTPVPTSAYVDQLGGRLTQALTENPEADLVDALSASIESTAKSLALEPGRSPSSTVAIARAAPGASVDALVLGDTQIAWPGGLLRDERIANVGSDLRDAYQERLAAGFGYDHEHRALLRQVQEEQEQQRNQLGGYWIAESDPLAALHALTAQWATAEAPWFVLATDGAYRPLQVLGLDDWWSVAQQPSVALHGLLDQCRHWETTSDPNGKLLPRAKSHDDKSLATALTSESA